MLGLRALVCCISRTSLCGSHDGVFQRKIRDLFELVIMGPGKYCWSEVPSQVPLLPLLCMDGLERALKRR